MNLNNTSWQCHEDQVQLVLYGEIQNTKIQKGLIMWWLPLFKAPPKVCNCMEAVELKASHPISLYSLYIISILYHLNISVYSLYVICMSSVCMFRGWQWSIISMGGSDMMLWGLCRTPIRKPQTNLHLSQSRPKKFALVRLCSALSREHHWTPVKWVGWLNREVLSGKLLPRVVRTPTDSKATPAFGLFCRFASILVLSLLLHHLLLLTLSWDWALHFTSDPRQWFFSLASNPGCCCVPKLFNCCGTHVIKACFYDTVASRPNQTNLVFNDFEKTTKLRTLFTSRWQPEL